MAFELFKLFGSIMVDNEKANESISKTEEKAEGAATKIGSSFSKMGKIVAGAVSVAGVVAFGKKSMEASAEIQAMESQFDQVFKDDNAKAVERITKQVDSLGIHADRLTGSWNSFGGQIKGAGMEGEKALEAVEKATRLAADSAAFYDRSLEESTGSLASFMKGNFAAGDAIGVFTNAKQMDSRANEMYGKSWADLAEDERQWLLLDTVEKTYEMNGAMGQASREAGAYENVMGNLGATFKRLYAVIGEPVLEVFLEIMQDVASWVEAHTPEIEAFIEKAFTTIKEVAYAAWDIFKNYLLPVFESVFNWAKRNWPTLQKLGENVFDAISGVVKTLWGWFKDNLLPIFQAVFEWGSDNWPKFQKVLEEAFNIVIGVVEILWKLFSDKILPIFETIFEWTKQNWPRIQAIIEPVFTAISDAAEVVWKWFNDNLLPIFESIYKWVDEHFPDLGGIITGAFELVISTVENVIKVFNDVKDAIGDAIDKIKEWAEQEKEAQELERKDRLNPVGSSTPEPDVAPPPSSGAIARSPANKLPSMALSSGMSYVPYDNFPATLHKGERVLTAAENKNYTGGGDIFNVTIDAKNIKEINDVIRVFNNLKQTARKGGVAIDHI